ncbi:MAG: mechanosensitive ion channel [Chloroflexota bacterium]
MRTIPVEWLDQLTEWLPNLLLAFAILIASLFLARLVAGLLQRVLRSRKADPEITLLLSQIARWSIIVVGVLTALQQFFDVTAFLAGVGILGFTVGFALQDIMKNFAAGVILLIQQPFNIGDTIETSSHGGNVISINLRATEMRTFDGRIVIIPNADILAHPITNYTRADRRRIEVPVGVGYDIDLELARRVALEATRAIPGFREEPAPMAIADAFGESVIKLVVYFWIDTTQIGLLDAKGEAVRLIKAAFDRHGIVIPYPIQTIHLDKPN